MEGRSNEWIAKQLNRTAACISNVRGRYSMRSYYRIDREEIRKLYSPTACAARVADYLGCSASSVHRVWRELGLPATGATYDTRERITQKIIKSQIRRRRLEGKVAELDMEKVIELFHDGYTDAEAAVELGVKESRYKAARLDARLRRHK